MMGVALNCRARLWDGSWRVRLDGFGVVMDVGFDEGCAASNMKHSLRRALTRYLVLRPRARCGGSWLCCVYGDAVACSVRVHVQLLAKVSVLHCKSPQTAQGGRQSAALASWHAGAKSVHPRLAL